MPAKKSVKSKKSASSKAKEKANKCPLILRAHRITEAFAKADDERDFYLEREEGFLVFADLDKSEEELENLEKALQSNPERYCPIPKMSFYEIKKLMEGFVNEKVYDIDVKEKLLDIIGSKEARENFLEFMCDHELELEKWNQYYQERFKIRIIEWLRENSFEFVFEEDLELPRQVVEKLKISAFDDKVARDVQQGRKVIESKAKTYYSSEALNPRPKRGRPPKQVAKVEVEPQFSQDIYLRIPKEIKPFLFAPDYQGTSSVFTFSGRFSSQEELLAYRKRQHQDVNVIETQDLNKKLETLRALSSSWAEAKGEVEEKESPMPLEKEKKKAVAVKKSETKTKEKRHLRAAPPKKKAKAKTKVRLRSIVKEDKAKPKVKAAAKKAPVKKASTKKKIIKKK